MAPLRDLGIEEALHTVLSDGQVAATAKVEPSRLCPAIPGKSRWIFRRVSAKTVFASG